jgi:hypothetical protein
MDGQDVDGAIEKVVSSNWLFVVTYGVSTRSSSCLDRLLRLLLLAVTYFSSAMAWDSSDPIDPPQ